MRTLGRSPGCGPQVGKKSHSMRLGFCSRSKDIIEPYLKPQLGRAPGGKEGGELLLEYSPGVP